MEGISDIVVRLRKQAEYTYCEKTMLEAADEIERLRAELEVERKKMEGIRDACEEFKDRKFE